MPTDRSNNSKGARGTRKEKFAALDESACKVIPDAKRTAVSPSRRKFLSNIGGASAAAYTLAAVGLGPLSGSATAENNVPPASSRVQIALKLRTDAAERDSQIPVPPHTTNGDKQRYPDHSASYSKGLLQDDIGVVNPAAWASFVKALHSGQNSDFEAIIIGGSHTLNGPQGSYAYDLETADSEQFGNAPWIGDQGGLPLVPPFAHIESADYGTQLVEMYWASLLRDVAFTDYVANSTAIAAAAELTTMPAYKGPRDGNGNVTPGILFRGPFAGDTIGPYMSQFMIVPTAFGAQPVNQLMTTYLPGIDYMTDTTTFLDVQNGISTGLTNKIDSVQRYLHDGRGLGAYTHVDVLYQAYLTAYMVLSSLKLPVNPGNPYNGSKTQNGFGTFGGPDFAATQGEVAARALNRVWFQKWLIHLTHRPEAGGGVLHQILSGNKSKIDARLNKNVLNSQAVAQSYSKYGTYLLSQAFPEGSPYHPSYPTGHGTVGGACITLLKFFFDGSQVWPNPMVPSNDGLSLEAYTGSDAGQITVAGELNKLAHNVSYGHGIHAGIHWRSDTETSLLLGEALALSFLRDRARTYHEKFTVQLTKLDGSVATITNE
jgi:hypothetical protein